VSTGIDPLDGLLGGLFIGDNVVWFDKVGSLASAFCLRFLEHSQEQEKPVVYVTFDRSPRNLLDKLGPLSENPSLTILDCFTWGKGAGSDVFVSFYQGVTDWPCRFVRVDDPRNINHVMDALYGVHASLEGEVHFIFESLTGAEELWGGEDKLLGFYAHSCPRLYELNTVAYWVMERDAHSQRLRAQISQIAQVVIELSVKRGRTYLTPLKAEKRDLKNFGTPYSYWTKGLTVSFDDGKKSGSNIDIGSSLKRIRKIRGLSQAELAKLVGLSPSAVSQIESGLIYPSIPALFKMAEVLSVELSSLMVGESTVAQRTVFRESEAASFGLAQAGSSGIGAKALIPLELPAPLRMYLIEIDPNQELRSHFFRHKGVEIGYVIQGNVEWTIDDQVHEAREGDTIYLASDVPTHWKNKGETAAKLVWINTSTSNDL
jgi:transcriptional regulator with XRE-family HTH domain